MVKGEDRNEGRRDGEKVMGRGGEVDTDEEK
jgi:hypothetical protein